MSNWTTLFLVNILNDARPDNPGVLLGVRVPGMAVTPQEGTPVQLSHKLHDDVIECVIDPLNRQTVITVKNQWCDDAAGVVAELRAAGWAEADRRSLPSACSEYMEAVPSR